MKQSWIAALTTVLLLQLASAQGAGAPWTQVGIPQAGPISISAPAAPAGGLVVGAVVSPGSAEMIDVIDLRMSSTLGRWGQKFEGLTSHSSEQIIVNGSSITIQSTPQQRVIVFLTLAAPRTISISSAAGTASFAGSSTGQSWDGVVPVSAIQGRTDLLLRAVSPAAFSASATPSISLSPSSSESRIVKRGHDYEVLDALFLRSQLTNYAEFGRTTPGRGRTLTIRASIQEDGSVSRVVCPTDAEPSSDCSIAVSAILRWRFKPFVSGKSAVPVVAQFPIVITAGGEFSSPLAPGVTILQ